MDMQHHETKGRWNLLLDPRLTSLHLCFLTFSLWFRFVAPEPTTKLCFFALSRLPRLTPHNANPVDRPPVLVRSIASRCRETPKNCLHRTSRMRAGVSCGFGSGSGLGLNHKAQDDFRHVRVTNPEWLYCLNIDEYCWYHMIVHCLIQRFRLFMWCCLCWFQSIGAIMSLALTNITRFTRYSIDNNVWKQATELAKRVAVEATARDPAYA